MQNFHDMNIHIILYPHLNDTISEMDLLEIGCLTKKYLNTNSKSY